MTHRIVKKYEIPKDELDRQLDEIIRGADLDELLLGRTSKCVAEATIGDLVEGEVVDIKNKTVLVDFGYKSEGLLPYEEDNHSNQDMDIGDKSVFVVADCREGIVSLSRKDVDRFLKQKQVIESLSVGQKVTGKIKQQIKNGWIIDLDGLLALLPSSQAYLVSSGSQSLLHQYIEAEVEAIEDMIVTLTRKSFAGEIKKLAKDQFFNNLEVGQIIEGVVKNITDFGAFIQIGSGVVGLCHSADIGSEPIKVGKKVATRILKLDTEKNRVSLGIRQVKEPSWNELASKYSVNDRVMVEVKAVVAYGAFLELEPGISGLLHVSDLSWSDHIRHPREVLSAGERIEVVILAIDHEKQHFSLGLKQINADPWKSVSDRYLTTSTVVGKIVNKTKFGIFVELEPGVEGLAHHTVDSRLLKPGDQVNVTILKIDAHAKKISLAIE